MNLSQTDADLEVVVVGKGRPAAAHPHHGQQGGRCWGGRRDGIALLGMDLTGVTWQPVEPVVQLAPDDAGTRCEPVGSNADRVPQDVGRLR